jgi:hypothetical protein
MPIAMEDAGLGMPSPVLECRKCGSNRVTGIGLAATVPIVGARCEVCGYITGFAVVKAGGSLPRSHQRDYILRFNISDRTRRLGLAVLWSGVACWILWADYLSAMNVSFPLSYILPVLLAANSGQRTLSFVVALAMPIGRAILLARGAWNTADDPVVTCVIQSFVLALIAFLVDRRRREIGTLRRLLRVCAWCKRVHVRDAVWEPIEAFFAQRSGDRFTHGMCPACTTHLNECLDDAAIPALRKEANA